ncbi:beta strand repeat-containing protein [Duganella sp. BuS-21]|uniref:beta strand repeat-containing protein n=1 Tax=Duganella sp. BuS-21 TaxID=2943848 RepID=UPI0035A6B34F
MTAPVLKTVTVSSNTTIVLHFDRAVSAGDANLVISDGYGQTYSGSSGLSTRIVGATDKHVIAADDGQVSYNGMDVTITLTSPLKNGLNYSVTMDSDAVVDSANESAGNDAISSPKFFNFVASGSAPTIATPSAVVGATLHFTDTGSNASDYLTATLDQTITGTYTGTLGTNDFVQVSLDNGASWHKASVNTGSKTWSYSEHVDEDNLVEGEGGTYGVLLARVSNNAGGSSASASHGYTYNNDPIEIFINGEAIRFSADTGSSDHDLITKTAAQAINGTYSSFLASGQTVQVSVNGGTTWVNTIAGDGMWHTNGTVALVSGSHSVMARVIDTAGNTSQTAYADYELDTTGLTLASRVLKLAEGSDNGVSTTDGVTSDATAVSLNVAGLHGVHAGDTIQIVDTSNGSAVVGSYVVQADDLYYGDDYFSDHPFLSQPTTLKNIPLDSLTQGTHVLAARIVDVAGNIGTASATTSVKYDTVAPVVSTSAPVEGATSVNNELTKLTFTFNENVLIENGSVVYITDDQNPGNSQILELSSSAVSGKVLTINLQTALTHGTSYTVSGLNVFDLAGNDAFSGGGEMLHFTTDGAYDGGGSGGGGSTPATPTVSIADTYPSSDSSLSDDGNTSDSLVRVEGLDSFGTWEYRWNPSDDWQEGSGSSFMLPDGDYAMDVIEVRQTVNGVTSNVGSISHTVTIDTQASTAVVVGSNSFSYGSNSISGVVGDVTDFGNDIVEITLDHGQTWLKATTTYVGPDGATWTLSGIADVLQAEYGLRLSDQAGNITPFADQDNTNPVYYLTNQDNGYNHPNDEYTTVFGGNGSDVITVGAHAIVFGNNPGGAGDSVTTANDAIVTVGANSTVTTGAGSNVVTAGHTASITTGLGADIILVSSLGGSGFVHAGAGNDTVTVTSVATLSLVDANITGVEHLHFGGSGANNLTISTFASVRNASDSGVLTITAIGSTSQVHLDTTAWNFQGLNSDGYNVYTSSSNEILLIGESITVGGLVA